MSGFIGTSTPDVIVGTAGPDQILGSGGADTLTGGGGADVFQYPFGSDSPIGLALVNGVGVIDHITDWSSQDFLQVFGGPVATADNFFVTSAPSAAAALQLSTQAQLAGETYSAVQAGSDVLVFDFHEGLVVDLVGRTLNDISFNNIGPDPSVLPPMQVSPPPVVMPPPVGPPALLAEPLLPPFRHPTDPAGASGQVWGDMDHAHISFALNAVIDGGSSTFVTADLGDIGLVMTGAGFAVDGAGHLAGGIATSIHYAYGADHGGQGFSFDFDVIAPTPLLALAGWALNDDSQSMFASMLSGNDGIIGVTGSSDLLRGYAGNDFVYGEGGDDTVFGGLGDDVIFADDPSHGASVTESTYLRGEDGDDYIVGGAGFDDANGNQGNDTISTGAGDDYSVGGKDNDLLFGDDGNDIVWGNLGNDTCDGGNGNDQVRGGQGDDLIYGGAGNDFISGDRGNDTEVGGAGADTFHGSQDAGIDRVLDFNLAEGDRVQLDPGTTYTVSQVGADTVIDMGASNGAPNQMILVGVNMTTLTGTWIFLG